MTTAIDFNDVSKIYRGAGGYRSLRDDIRDVVSRRGRDTNRPKSVVTALRDVSFQIPAGQSVGLIGENGAGKSTSLKIISGITYPTAGRVTVRGRVGALIEVGTGLHQELTGRENVMLYGRILGFSGRDIKARFDEIVEFAGLGSAIDQPVKQYSSGMELRLGFAIASHLEPDVLIVDEAISVGDASFQHRCVERMSAVVRDGRTLLFVTHNLAAVEALCNRALLLTSGTLEMDGHPKDVIHEYLQRVHSELLASGSGRPIAGVGIEILETTLHDAGGAETSEVRPGDSLTVRLRYNATREIVSPQFSIGIADPALGTLAMATMLIDGHELGSIKGEGWIECRFASLPFKPRTYDVVCSVRESFGRLIDPQRVARFLIEDADALTRSGTNVVSLSTRGAPVALPYQWRFSGEADAGNNSSPHAGVAALEA